MKVRLFLTCGTSPASVFESPYPLLYDLRSGLQRPHHRVLSSRHRRIHLVSVRSRRETIGHWMRSASIGPRTTVPSNSRLLMIPFLTPAMGILFSSPVVLTNRVRPSTTLANTP